MQAANAAAATAAYWRDSAPKHETQLLCRQLLHDVPECVRSTFPDFDNEFLKAASATLPSLLSSIEALESALAQIEAQRFTEMGFRAVKIRVGHDLPTDLDRIRTVQSELGDGIAVYTDANQAFEPKEAIRRGLALADAGVTWFEEPVAAGDFAGHAMVRAALPIDVASGETEYTRFGMQQYLDAGSVDVLMPDLQRVGGYTEFKVAASAAAAKNVPISSHFFTEYSLAVGGSEVGCRTIESIDWFQPLFNEAPELVDGQLVVPDRPGHGFTFDRKAVAHHAVD